MTIRVCVNNKLLDNWARGMLATMHSVTRIIANDYDYLIPVKTNRLQNVRYIAQ